jgi:RNA polymerase sigma factor (sigma-70 family)
LRQADWSDVEAFARRDQPILFAFAYSLCGDQHHALDLVQDAVLSTALAWDRVRDPLTYARRCVLNGFLTQKRRRRRERLVASPPDSGTTSAAPFDQTLLAALDSLPRHQQVVLVLRYLHDLSDTEIASAIGGAPSTVRSHARRGLQSLRRTWLPLTETP